MRHMIKIILLLGLCLNVVSAQQSSVGTISIFLLKDGIPLKGNEVLIDGKTKYLTDEDGATKLTLPTGKHLIEIVAKDTEGTNLGYSKKNVEIKTNRDTQVVASFSAKEKSPNIDIDVPVGKVLENTKKVDVAQGTGIINGRVISSEGKRAISGARIFVRGTSVDARTDANGRFSVKVPAGINLAISVVHSAYSAATVNGIKVQNGRTVSKSISLTPASMELEEFVVLAPKIEGSLSSVVQEEKKINAIANILGSEELSKKGDSSAAGALKRVAGITLVGNTVYVRGLGDRYSNVEMNGLPLPSPHPVKRTVPLDIFPSGVIKSIKVQKSATGDIPAGFGGGYIDIRTKDAVKENYLKVTLGAKGNTNTGDTVYTYQGSSSDWMGIDDGYRAIPAEILNQSAITVGEAVTSFDEAFGYTQEQLDQYMTEIVNRELKPKKWNLPFGGKLGIEGAYQTEIAPEQTINVFVNYNYDQDYRYREENYFSYAYNKEEDKLYSEPEQYGTVYRTTENYSHTAMFNLSYNYADVLHLKYTKLYTLHSESETRITDGIANSDDDWKIRYSLNWDERSMNIDQLSGDFKYRFLNYDNKLMFGMELAKAKLNQPGNYKYAYLRDIRFDGVVQGDPYLDRFSPNVFLNLTSDDDLNALYIKNKTDINIFSKKDTLEIGMSHSKKSRKSRYNKYQIDQGQGDKLTVNIDTIYDNNVRNNTDLFSVNIAFRP
ncbi:MAG TPA: hypothetical protein ENK90_03780, partial [Epsilonproteobacteria bacterium]|nr:hypothetical protein [Campylobacterota bacterium]